MSKSPTNEANSSDVSLNTDETRTEKSPEKPKLNLSQSENSLNHQKTIKQKLLGKVKSWSSKDHHSKDKRVSVELDLAQSLSRLDVVESDNIAFNLVNARDSLEHLPKDEQNMPKANLDKSILINKPRHSPDSPKSSPQLGEKWKATTSKSIWDPYDKQGRKNRKDIKKKQKISRNESPRNESSSVPIEGKGVSITIKSEDAEEDVDVEPSTTEETSVMEEENNYKYRYFPKNSKSVVFTNEVLVVYFNNEDVVGEAKEPLKRETEQQSRNKEMRRIHLNKTQEKNNLCLY